MEPAVEEVKLVISGKWGDKFLEKAKACAAFLSDNNPEVSYEVYTFFETQWDDYLRELPKTIPSKQSPLILKSNGEVIGGMDEFLTWSLVNYRYSDSQANILYQRMANKAMKERTLLNKDREYAFMTVQIGDSLPIKIVYELFVDICPKTCERFISLCKSDFTPGKSSKKFGYKDTKIDRVNPESYIEGGQIPEILEWEEKREKTSDDPVFCCH